MIAIIFAGGTGSRLWPLSTPLTPKQFLSPTDDPRSLLQQTYDRVRPLTEDIFVVTPESQADQVRQCLPALDDRFLILEPQPRGVASAILLVLRRLCQLNRQAEPAIFLWSDHWIGDEGRFRQQLTAVATAVESGLDMVRFGVQPTFAATNFGYIKLGRPRPEVDRLYQLESFREKPDRATAEEFLASGQYLWNMGYFMTTAERFERLIAAASPRLHQALGRVVACANDAALGQLYSQLPEISFEFDVAKNMTGVQVVACDFPWADIGSFRDLLAVLPTDDRGNAIKGLVHARDLSDSYINNQTNIPLAVLGLKDIAVVATDQGLLVADPILVAEIGEVAKLIQAGGQTNAETKDSPADNQNPEIGP